jgi:phage-related tail protein
VLQEEAQRHMQERRKNKKDDTQEKMMENMQEHMKEFAENLEQEIEEQRQQLIDTSGKHRAQDRTGGGRMAGRERQQKRRHTEAVHRVNIHHLFFYIFCSPFLCVCVQSELESREEAPRL